MKQLSLDFRPAVTFHPPEWLPDPNSFHLLFCRILGERFGVAKFIAGAYTVEYYENLELRATVEDEMRLQLQRAIEAVT